MLRLLSVHTSGLVLEGYPRVECAPPQLAKRAVRHTKEENSGQVTCLKKVWNAEAENVSQLRFHAQQFNWTLGVLGKAILVVI